MINEQEHILINNSKIQDILENELILLISPNGIILESKNLDINDNNIKLSNIKDFFPSHIYNTINNYIINIFNPNNKSSFEFSFNLNNNHFYDTIISKITDDIAMLFIKNIDKQKSMELKLEYINSLQCTLNEISSNLMQSHQTNFENLLNDSLAKLGKSTQVDRVYIFEFDYDLYFCSNTYEWCANGISSQISNLQMLPLDVFPNWIKLLNQNKYIYIPSIQDMGEEFFIEKELLENQDIKSLVLAPMYNGDKLAGFIGFDSVKKYKYWDNEIINILKLASNIFSGSIFRYRFESDLLNQKIIAENANRIKTRYLSNLSKEIKNPINSIINYSELLANHNLSNICVNYSQIIHKNAKNMYSLINDILDLSKIETGLLDINKLPMSVKELFIEIYENFIQEVNYKKLNFSYKIQDKLPALIEFDYDKLNKILSIVINNAIKFTDKGNIELKGDIIYGSGNNLIDIRFTITDTGNAISEAYFNKIFDSFSNNNGTSLEFDNSGIDIIICKKLIEALAGTIYVESQLGKGSVYVIEFFKVKISHKELSKSFKNNNDDLLSIYDADINLLVAQKLVDSTDKKVLLKFLDEFEDNFKELLIELLDYFDEDLINEAMDNFNILSEDYAIESFLDLTQQVKDAALEFDIKLINECISTILISIEYCRRLLHNS